MRRMAGLLFAGGLAAGLGAGMTAIAHASDPMRPAQAGTRLGRTTGAGVVRSAATTPALPSPDTR